MADIVYHVINQGSPELSTDLEAIYRAVGWWSEDFDVEWLMDIPKVSTAFVVAACDGKTIGMGRALSDGISDAYIQDIAVLPEYRGRGVGAGIVCELIRNLRERGVDWIGLIATPGQEAFYNKLGFHAMAGYTPMKLEGGE